MEVFIMSEFTRGAFWAAGMYLFGKGVYELGRQHEAKRICKELDKITKEMEKELKKERKEKSKKYPWGTEEA